MILTTQCTQSYYLRAQPLFDSVKKYWPYEFKVGTIGFGDGDYRMDIADVKTYRHNYPKNRSMFVCPQGGEFIDFLDVPDDEIVINIDADCIMQRAFTQAELSMITPKDNEIIVTYPCWPPQTLKQVSKNLKFKHTDKFPDLFNIEFCGAFLVARASTFRKLRDLVVAKFDDLVEVNDHHAGIQFLISYLSYKHLHVKYVPNTFQCGSWYLHDYNFSRIGGRLAIDGEVVIFNHTKFHK